MRKKIVAMFIVGAMGLSGCAQFKDRKSMEEHQVQANEVIEQVDKLVVEVNERDTKPKEYMHYSLTPEVGDFSTLSSTQEMEIKITEKATLYDVLTEVAVIENKGIVYDLSSTNVLFEKAPKVYTFKRDIRSLVQILERAADVDIYFTDQNVVVSDKIAISGNFGKLEGGASSDKVYEKLEGYLKTVLTEGVSEDQKSGVRSRKEPQIMIDPSTGAFYISASPNLMRNTKNIIENVINSSMSYALLKLEIYKVDDNKAIEMGISAEKIVNNLYSLSLSAPTSGVTPTFDFLRNKVDKNGDSFKLGVSAYEQTGVLRSEESLVLTLYNGVMTQYTNTEEDGNWLPGDLTEQNNVTNGVVQTIYLEDKPEFEVKKVGRTLNALPRIDLQERTVNLEIDYTDSRVSGEKVTTWQRAPEMPPVEITMTLIGENKINGVMLLDEVGYGVLSGNKYRDGGVSQNTVPGAVGTVLDNLGMNTSNASKTMNIIVAKPVFPEKKRIKVIDKVRAY